MLKMKIKEKIKNTQTNMHVFKRLLEFNSFTIGMFGHKLLDTSYLKLIFCNKKQGLLIISKSFAGLNTFIYFLLCIDGGLRLWKAIKGSSYTINQEVLP